MVLNFLLGKNTKKTLTLKLNTTQDSPKPYLEILAKLELNYKMFSVLSLKLKNEKFWLKF